MLLACPEAFCRHVRQPQMGRQGPAGLWVGTSDSTAARVSDDRLRPLSSYAMAVGPREELMPYFVTIARASLVACTWPS